MSQTGTCIISRRCYVFDFKDGNGPVPAYRFNGGDPQHARQHRNPNGRFGGWVANTARVSPSAYIGPSVEVFGAAQVSDEARITGQTIICDSAQVYGSARVGGRSTLTHNARVGGSARVFNSYIHSSALVEKPEDFRRGDGWTAFRTDSEKPVLFFSGGFRTLSSWDELPRALYELGFLSAMEYLATAFEVPEPAP